MRESEALRANVDGLVDAWDAYGNLGDVVPMVDEGGFDAELARALGTSRLSATRARALMVALRDRAAWVDVALPHASVVRGRAKLFAVALAGPTAAVESFLASDDGFAGLLSTFKSHGVVARSALLSVPRVAFGPVALAATGPHGLRLALGSLVHANVDAPAGPAQMDGAAAYLRASIPLAPAMEPVVPDGPGGGARAYRALLCMRFLPHPERSDYATRLGAGPGGEEAAAAWHAHAGLHLGTFGLATSLPRGIDRCLGEVARDVVGTSLAGAMAAAGVGPESTADEARVLRRDGRVEVTLAFGGRSVGPAVVPATLVDCDREGFARYVATLAPLTREEATDPPSRGGPTA